MEEVVLKKSQYAKGTATYLYKATEKAEKFRIDKDAKDVEFIISGDGKGDTVDLTGFTFQYEGAGRFGSSRKVYRDDWRNITVEVENDAKVENASDGFIAETGKKLKTVGMFLSSLLP